jgi:hypothetical protein
VRKLNESAQVFGCCFFDSYQVSERMNEMKWRINDKNANNKHRSPQIMLEEEREREFDWPSYS